MLDRGTRVLTDNTHHDHGAGAGGIGLVTVILALIFLFVWPGPLRWEYVGSKAEVKIDRISHQVWDYDFKSNQWRQR